MIWFNFGCLIQQITLFRMTLSTGMSLHFLMSNFISSSNFLEYWSSFETKLYLFKSAYIYGLPKAFNPSIVHEDHTNRKDDFKTTTYDHETKKFKNFDLGTFGFIGRKVTITHVHLFLITFFYSKKNSNTCISLTFSELPMIAAHLPPTDTMIGTTTDK